MICLAAGLVSGCASPPPGSTVCELSEWLPASPARRQSGVLDLGTPEARLRLGRGWSNDETDSSGRTFVWSVGLVSEISMVVVDPTQPLGLTLEGAPAPGGRASGREPAAERSGAGPVLDGAGATVDTGSSSR